MQYSTQAKDTMSVKMFQHAHAPALATPLDSILKYDFHSTNYIGIGDIISSNTTMLHQQTGDPLNYSGISIFNSHVSTSVISFNGVPVHDMISGSGDLFGVQTESIHKISIYTGMDASILGGTSGPFFYIQENMYSSVKPFSRIWYVQGGYDLIGTEGVLTQNIDSLTNIHASYRRLSSSGMLRNGGADMWNTRVGIRHSYSESVHASLQWLFSNQGAYHNGGVYGTYESPLNATAMYDNYFDRTYTNTIQGTITVDKIVNEHSSLILNAFIGNSLLETRGINPYQFNDTSMLEYSPHFRTGINGRLELPHLVNNLSIMSEFGFNYSTFNILNRLNDQELQAYGYAYASYALTNSDIVKAGFRTSTETEGNVNYGFSYTKNIDAWKVCLDYSSTQTIQPLLYGLITDTTREMTNLAYVELEYHTKHSVFGIQTFYRKSEYPFNLIVNYDSISSFPRFSGLSRIQGSIFESYGLTAFADLRIGAFQLHTFCTYTKQQDEMRISPRLYAQIQAQYETYFGASSVSFGGTLRVNDGPTTLRYIPYVQTLAHDGFYGYDSFQWNGLDLHVTAILGNARIRASMMNVFSEQFMDISGYPLQDNVIRLSLNWSFFD